jgi:hypothetical protein
MPRLITTALPLRAGPQKIAYNGITATRIHKVASQVASDRRSPVVAGQDAHRPADGDHGTFLGLLVEVIQGGIRRSLVSRATTMPAASLSDHPRFEAFDRARIAFRPRERVLSIRGTDTSGRALLMEPERVIPCRPGTDESNPPGFRKLQVDGLTQLDPVSRL